ncbi:hypothetical protein FA95DRAFT_1551602 [Auriscalpium vulgare]|uniref:Uncharacterized protein n=1 Tax=Auriscalpium vulgare TaxID=40419 RepID=A0ACB8SBG0_9AGAM|nr:hypothetical protein FA95DRAFT_1551602 [Auriscalpium vulgare]
MANPRQRRKGRSSSHRAVQHSRRAKKLLKKQPAIRGPKVLGEAWDKHKTVRQNYAALGLAASLNPKTSGGVERVARNTEARAPADEDTNMTSSDSHAISQAAPRGGLSKGVGRILRDESGAITGVEIDDEEEERSNARCREELIEERASVLAPETMPWVTLGRAEGQEKERTEVVQALEKVSGVTAGTARYSSKSEVQYLRRLVGKHLDDVEGMARDRRLNTEQRTAGELRRAIRKAGGVAQLGV